MIAEIEKIIKSKAYIELTADERLMINEWVEGEDAFNEMKWFLIESEKAVQTDKIEASSALKKNVMAHLTATQKKKGIWLNTAAPLTVVGGTKKIYQKPLFQLAVAACLVVGFLVFYTTDFKNDSLALNTNKLKENTVEERQQKRVPKNSLIPVNDQEKTELVLEKSKVDEGIVASKKELDAVSPPELEDVPVVADVKSLEELVVPNEEVVMGVDDFEVADLEEELEEVEAYSDKAMEVNEVTAPFVTQSKEDGAENNLFEDKRKRSNRRGDRLKKREDAVSTNQYGLDETYQAVSENNDEVLEKTSASIHPKSLHINETKKFNQLFFTVK